MPSALIHQPVPLTKCVHCALEFRFEKGKTPSANFCCWGCKTVFELLSQSGLQKFYDIKAGGVCFNKPLPIFGVNSNFTHWDDLNREIQIYVAGIHCSACLWLLEQIPQVLIGQVESARLDIGKSLLYITLSPSGQASSVAALIQAWGYRPRRVSELQEVRELQASEARTQLVQLGIAGALAGNIMLMSLGVYAGATGAMATLFEGVSGVLAVPVVFYSGQSLFVNVWRSIKNKYFSIDTPILVAILSAFTWSCVNLLQGRHAVYFDSLTALIFLILTSRYVLAMLRRFDLSLPSAIENEGTTMSVKLGEIVSLQSEQNLNFDAVVRSGSCFVDQSFLTGESAAVLICEGEMIYAGSSIQGFSEKDTAIKVEVIAVGDETRLAKIIEQIKNTKSQTSQIERLYDQYAKRLMLVVLLVSAILFTYLAYQGMWEAAVGRTMALLIVTCPCALAFATPLNISLALRRAFKLGLVIKNPDGFEVAQKINNIFFDKTGTLTTARLRIISSDIAQSEIRNLRALVSPSKHPVARAIMSAVEIGVTAQCESWREIVGLGISAHIDDHQYELKKSASDLQITSPSVELFKDREFLGRITLANPLRAEARAVTSDLQGQGFNLHILSGDRSAVVRGVAQELKINSLRARGELSPEEKAQAVSPEDSLFVGDGINDALALKKATFGIAMHGGLQAALENSTAYMLRPDLKLVGEYFSLSRKVRKIHRVNFIYSTFYNLVSGALAIMGLMNPLIAAVVMPVSATTVFAYTFLSYRRAKVLGGNT